MFKFTLLDVGFLEKNNTCNTDYNVYFYSGFSFLIEYNVLTVVGNVTLTTSFFLCMSFMYCAMCF